MKTKFFLIIFSAFLCLNLLSLNAQKITILYDNYLHKDKYQADWGFSCMIDYQGQTLLFDTGTKKDVFIHNLIELKENLNRLDMIIISHNHGDHSGNLHTVLETKNDLTVYMPFTTPDAEIKKIKETGAKVIHDKKPRNLGKGRYLTGEMGTSIKEQALILNTVKGLVIITGCAHPGITEIVSHAKALHKTDVYLVLGGFHLIEHSKEQIEEIIDDFKDMGVRNVAPTHCTGDEAIEMFKEAYGDNYIRIGVGKKIDVSKQ